MSNSPVHSRRSANIRKKLIIKDQNVLFTTGNYSSYCGQIYLTTTYSLIRADCCKFTKIKHSAHDMNWQLHILNKTYILFYAKQFENNHMTYSSATNHNPISRLQTETTVNFIQRYQKLHKCPVQ